MTKTYVVPGDPVALARVRYGKGKFYDSQKHIKLAWGINLNRIHEDGPKFEGPIFMDVIFYMAFPKNYSQLKKDKLYGQWHIIKPDTSNLLKFVEDAATTILYDDDCIIAKQSIEKCYDDGKGPRTEFTIGNLTKR